MTAGEQLDRLIIQCCTAHWLVASIQKLPHSFGGITLYASEAHTLMTIAQHEGISQSQLSELMMRTKGATSAMVDRLTEKGLVCRQRAEGDQRRYLLTMTPLGRQINEELGLWLAGQANRLAQALDLPCEDLEAANRVVSAMLAHYAELYRSGGLEI